MHQLNYTYDKKRFETFIDAIIAIILTILILELRVPETAHSESTQRQVLALIPAFVSYLGSFLLIAGVWIDHHLLFLNLERITKRYILMNMYFILSLSIVPFTTAFAGYNHNDSFAVALLFGNYFVMNLAFSSLYLYALKKRLLPREFFTNNKATGIYSLVGIIGLAIAIPLAYVNTYVSFALGIVIFTGHLFKKK